MSASGSVRSAVAPKSREDDEARLQNARETIDSLFDLSQLLNTGLDKQTLSICVRMIEDGANPETLAAVIKELRKESEALRSPTPR